MEYATLNPEQRKIVENAIKEVSALQFQIESAREAIKDIGKHVKEETDLKPGLFNKIAKMYHKQSKSEVEQEHEKLTGLYDEVFPQKGFVDDAPEQLEDPSESLRDMLNNGI